ncbi:MAG: Tape measure protein [Bacteroidota bacterium]|jgi:tape measure domain-containing protein
MSDIKFTITALDSASKTLDAIDKKAKSVESTFSKLSKSLGSSLKIESLSQLNQKFIDPNFNKQQDKLRRENERQYNFLKNNFEKELNRNLKEKERIQKSQLQESKRKADYNDFLKKNFEKELNKNLKEKEKEQKQTQKQEMFFAKQQEREQKILRKEQEDNYKRQIKIEEQRKKTFEKAIQDERNAKVSPINYVRDKKGNVISVVGEKSTTASISGSLGLGGRTLTREEAQGYRGRGGFSQNNEGGFLGGRRTFGQVLGGYAAYRLAVGTENAASAIINTPIELENVRASLDAMNFASGIKDKMGYQKKTKSDINFLYNLGQIYGIDFTSIAPEFMRMQSIRAGSKKSKYSDQDMRDITQAFTGLSRVSGLSSADTKLVFLAVSQMLALNKLQGQEVNQQLLEKMGIARPVLEAAIKKVIFSEKIKKSNPRLYGMWGKYRKEEISLNKLMQDGVLGAGILTEVLGVTQEMLGGMVEEKSHTFTGSVGRFASVSKQAIDLASQQGGFPSQLAKNIDRVSKGIHYFNKIGMSDELNPDNSYYDIAHAKYKGKDVSELRKIASLGYKFANQSLMPATFWSGVAYAYRYASKKILKKAALQLLKRGPLSYIAGPHLTGTVFATNIASDIIPALIEGGQKNAQYNIGSDAEQREIDKFKDFYRGRYKEDAPILPGQNNMSMDPNLFVNSLLSKRKKPQQNMTYIKPQADPVKDFLKTIDYFPKNISLMGINQPQITQLPEEPLQGDFPNQGRQQIELILKIEEMPKGFTSNIYTSGGQKLDTGINMITGKYAS